MAQLNSNKVPTRFTHEGAPAKNINPLQELRRSVMACLLWEDTFYEDGQSIADRIKSLVHQCDPIDVSKMAIAARSEYRLRHAPLMLVRELARHPKAKGQLIGDTIADVIQRADELSEFVAMYWADGKQPFSAQVKKGLAKAFQKFDAYQLAKYNRDNAVKLRDVLFLCHAKPKDKLQEQNWKQLTEGTLAAPDTWEVALSGGENKQQSFTRLLTENKLGYMALLRNLRNMQEAGVNEDLVFDRLREGAAKSKALPFRYLSATQAVPQWEPVLDEAMQVALSEMPRLTGKTIILVDTSGSMSWSLSSKSKLNRMDSACALAVLVAGIAERHEVFAFANHVYEIPPRKGMALVDAIKGAPSGGTYLGEAVKLMNDRDYDRLIVITDEQSADRVPDPKGIGYMINVASNQNGVGYHKWTHIDGFSEAVIKWIQIYEAG